MKKIAIVIVLALILMFFLKSYFGANPIPDECNVFFETKRKLLYEVKTSQYVSDDFIKQYENKNNEFISLFKKGIKRESNKEKTKKVCKGLNDFWSDRLKSLKQAKSEKEFNSLL